MKLNHKKVKFYVARHSEFWIKNVVTYDWFKRRVISNQKYLNKRCVSVWLFSNPLGEYFIFGKFVNKDKTEETIVTLANKLSNGRWMPSI